MKNYGRMISDILGQIYQEECLRKCLQDTVRIHPERIRILHYVIMNIDCLSKVEIRERAFKYAQTIRGDELVARQIFLLLLRLADM